MPYDKIYEVRFGNGQVFEGGNLEYPGWNKCESEGITSLDVQLPYGEILRLAGYAQYNFFIGVGKSLSSGKPKVQHIYALGERKGIVTSYRITILGAEGDKHKVGDITVRKFPFGKEGIGRTATTGWKVGTETE